ncbi:MAG TPA: transporter substrate-binding domain-containing protein [Gaiella sp.]|nr:transporter substrate-binding domain-containing protein [Gaiella sp.]
MRRRRLRRIRNRRASLVVAACALAMAPVAANAAESATPPSSTAPTPPTNLVVALGLRDPALGAGVVRGGEVVLARGFEVELAKVLARRLGVRVDRFVELRPAGRLLAGGPAGWQLALAGIEPSRTTRGADLSDPYLTTDAAVVLRRHLPRPRGLAELRGSVLCAIRGSDEARTITTTVRPRTTPVLATRTDRLRELLRTGACDAALVPASEAGRFVRGHGRELGRVTGRVESGDGLVVAVPRGTGLDVAAVDRALARLRSDGTLGHLARSWLGLDPARLRTLR